MKSSKIIILFFIASYSGYAQQWPIDQADDPTNWENITGTFGEIHPTGGDHFHGALDIDVTAFNCPVRAIESNSVMLDNLGDFISIEIEYPPNSGLYNRRAVYGHLLETSSALLARPSNGDALTIGQEIAKIQESTGNPGTSDHLHFELWQRENNRWLKINPFGNEFDWHYESPTDTDPAEVNDIVIIPQDAGSGFRIIHQHEGTLSAFHNTNLRVRLANRTASSSNSVYDHGRDKFLVYGNVSFILRARDPNLNVGGFGTGGDGAGLTIDNAKLFIDGRPFYEIDFSSFITSPVADRETFSVNDIFHTEFNANNDQRFGNNDYIEMYSENNTYLGVDQRINGRRSNGIWYTKAKGNTVDVVFDAAPELAKIPKQSIYRDGQHEIRTYVHDASNLYESRIVNVIVDNFLPYVEKVVIKNKSSEEVVYTGIWALIGDNLSLFPSDRIRGKAEIDGDIIVEVTTSELMQDQSLTISVDGQNYFDYALDKYEFGSRTYTFELPAPNRGGLHTLIIDGYDLAGNRLQSNPTNIGSRNNAGQWINASPGEDTSHEFEVGISSCDSDRRRTLFQRTVTSCNDGLTVGCDYVDIEFDVPNPSTNAPVIITPTVSGQEDDWTYSWSFGSGATPSSSTDAGPQTVLYSTTGSKSISLTITPKNGESPITITKPNCLVVGSNPQGSELVVDFDKAATQPDYVLTPGEDIYLVSTVSGVSGTARYEWDLGLDASATGTSSSAVNVSWEERGQKTVSLTVRDQNQTVVETKNAFISVSEYASPIRADIACPNRFPQGNNLSFAGSYLIGTGDEIRGNESYIWDFGDGQVADGDLVSNIYQSPGNYTVTLKVCDNSGCDEASCVVSIPQNAFPPQTSNTNWTVDGELALRYENSGPGGGLGSGGLGGIDNPGNNVTAIPNFTYGMTGIPIKIENLTKTVNGGNPVDVTFQFVHPHEQTTIIRSRGTFYFTPKQEGRYVVHATKNGFYGQETVQGRIDVDAVDPIERSISYCDAEITDLRLDTYCYDPDNPPRLLVDFKPGSCGVDGVSFAGMPPSNSNVFVGGGGTVSGNTMEVNWSSLQLLSEDQLPYTFELTASLTREMELRDFGGSYIDHQIVSPKKIQSFTVYPTPTLDLVTQSFDFCKGASGQIGLPATPNISYEWILESGPSNGINLLSSRSVSNPVFTAVEDGKTYLFTLNATHNETGCTVSKEVTVTTSGIGTRPYSRKVTAGDAPVILEAPVTGGGSDYEYQWSPAINLDNPRSPNPIYTVPTFKNTQNYTVDVSFRGSCMATANVQVITENLPPSDLLAELSDYGVVKLTWQDNSVEEYFIVRKK
ncbi:MAG: PKD domain-containing protein, partial [Bacteroidota bacterium]